MLGGYGISHTTLRRNFILLIIDYAKNRLHAKKKKFSLLISLQPLWWVLSPALSTPLPRSYKSRTLSVQNYQLKLQQRPFSFTRLQILYDHRTATCYTCKFSQPLTKLACGFLWVGYLVISKIKRKDQDTIHCRLLIIFLG